MDTKQSFAIELTDEESALASEIEFDASEIDGPEHAQENGRRVTELMWALIKRGAIPEHRWRYFDDAAYNIGGRGASRRSIFERNGCHGNAMFAHGHYLPYLHYILYGADLPDRTRAEFRDAVNECGFVTSSDVVPLGLKARRMARALGLRPTQAREEFFKLALDCGLNPSTAASIRESAGQK